MTLPLDQRPSGTTPPLWSRYTAFEAGAYTADCYLGGARILTWDVNLNAFTFPAATPYCVHGNLHPASSNASGAGLANAISGATASVQRTLPHAPFL